MNVINLTLPDWSQTETTLAKLCAQSNYTLLYFYPKDSTSGCTLEAQGFSALLPEFDKLHTHIVGVSKDSHYSHCKFQNKYNLNIPLIADTDLELHMQFGTWVEKSMYGRKYMWSERSSFLLDKDGTIVYKWIKVKPATHPQEVVEYIKAIKNT